MKKTAYASAALAFIALILGMLFMLYQAPYSYYILAISMFLLAASLIIFYTLDKKQMYVAGAIFCFLPTVGLMFSQLNLPGAEILVSVGLVLFALTFVPWFAYQCYKG